MVIEKQLMVKENELHTVRDDSMARVEISSSCLLMISHASFVRQRTIAARLKKVRLCYENTRLQVLRRDACSYKAVHHDLIKA